MRSSPKKKLLQLGSGGGSSSQPRARVHDKSALEAGLQFLVASGFRPAHHGAEVWERSRAEGEAARADKVLQVCLTGNREPGEEVVLDAEVERLPQGDGE